jgi:hypothetical protein
MPLTVASILASPMPACPARAVRHGRKTWASATLLAASVAFCGVAEVAHAGGGPGYSAAERLLFMSEPLPALKPPLTLNYTFRKSGALEPGYEDRVAIDLRAAPDGSCCSATGRFLTGEHAVMLPDVEQARSNPVLLYFLEHDVRDMKRLTNGAPAYFRKRIRLAIADEATVRDVALTYQGQTIAGRLVEIEPYRNDPTRQRYARYADKAYHFYISDAVPGGIYGMRSVMRAPASGQPPLIVEQIFIEGGSAPAEPPATETPRS